MLRRQARLLVRWLTRSATFAFAAELEIAHIKLHHCTLNMTHINKVLHSDQHCCSQCTAHSVLQCTGSETLQTSVSAGYNNAIASRLIATELPLDPANENWTTESIFSSLKVGSLRSVVWFSFVSSSPPITARVPYHATKSALQFWPGCSSQFWTRGPKALISKSR